MSRITIVGAACFFIFVTCLVLSWTSEMSTNVSTIARSVESVENMIRRQRFNRLAVYETKPKEIPQVITNNDDNITAEYTAYIEMQSTLRRKIINDLNSSSEAAKFASIYGSLAPETKCSKLIRIGNLGDGGKWICNPWKLPNNCIIVSLGLNNQVDFEKEIQKMNSKRCRLIGIDKDEQNETTKTEYSNMNGKSVAAEISMTTNAARSKYTIEDAIKGENITAIDILKVDIEGAEHDALIPFLEKMNACQILLEIHGKAVKHRDLLVKIAKLDYLLFSYEVNGYSMEACEYSFVHAECLDFYGFSKVIRFLV